MHGLIRWCAQTAGAQTDHAANDAQLRGTPLRPCDPFTPHGPLCMHSGQLDALPLGLTSLSEPAGQSDGFSDASESAPAASAEGPAPADAAPEPLLEPCLSPELLQQLLQCLLDNWEVISANLQL